VVIPNALSLSGFEKSHALDEQIASHGRYVLFVGNISPKKNLARLCAAIELASKQEPTIKMLIAGDVKKIFVKQHLPATERTTLLGYLADDEKWAYVRNAHMLVLPSTNDETFGLPLLEAMAAGVPTVSSDLATLSSVYGEATLYADPFDEHAMAAAIEKVWSDLLP